MTSVPVTAHRPSSSVRLVALASLVGTTIEWYDFFLYGTAAALVFNVLFFPTFSPLSGTLAAFGTYAVGFVARPVGGIVFGHYGDRLGRKSMQGGRCAVYLGGALFTVAYAYPFFVLLDTGYPPSVWLALVLASAGSHAPMYAPQAAFFSELFGTHVRYTGASLGSQLASVFAGGLSPFVATALLARYGRPALSLFMAGVALVSVVAVVAAAETAHGDLDET